MAKKFDAAALATFRQDVSVLLYRKMFPEQAKNFDWYMQSRSYLANLNPVTFALHRNEDNRLVLRRQEMVFGTEWRFVNGPAAPKKSNVLQISSERKRIMKKANETKRKLVFEDVSPPMPMQAPAKLTFAPKKNVRAKAAKSTTWSLRRQVLQRCFNAKRELNYNQEGKKEQKEGTPRKRSHATMQENRQPKDALKIKRRLICDNDNEQQ